MIYLKTQNNIPKSSPSKEKPWRFPTIQKLTPLKINSKNKHPQSLDTSTVSKINLLRARKKQSVWIQLV